MSNNSLANLFTPSRRFRFWIIVRAQDSRTGILVKLLMRYGKI